MLEERKIYHITHVNNLNAIIKSDCLHSDAYMIKHGNNQSIIGMSTIKQRRLNLPVECNSGTFVGDYVPFYFCPRSIMLYVIHCANHPELTYKGGQEPIIHLEADLHETIQNARKSKIPWAFSLSNAGAYYTIFYNRSENIEELNWRAINSTDFRDPIIKEGKQAEFLLYDEFPWKLVRRIGVYSAKICKRVSNIVLQSRHRPNVEIMKQWYF